MGIVDRVRNALTRTKQGGGPIGPSGLGVSWPSNWFQLGWSPQPQTRGGSVVEACVQAYAQTIAQLPGRHFMRDEDGTKTYTNGSRLARALAKPNDFQTRSDFVLNVVYSLLYEGNAYILGTSRDNRTPEQMYVLDPTVTQAHRVPETGDVVYSTSGEFFDMADVNLIEGRAIIPSRFIGHARLYTPRDPLVGVSPLENAAASVNAHGSIVNNQAAFFNNMSRPSGFISTDLAINKEQMQQLREAWEDQSKNLNAGGVPILASGMKWNSMTISSQDAQLVEAWKMTVEDISRVFRVPPMLINNLENSTFDNAETLMRFWLASGLGFHINALELVIASLFRLDDRFEGVEFQQDLLLQADLQSRLDALGSGVTKGIYAPNEARRREGLPPVENGDVPLVQQQMVPVNLAGEGLQLTNSGAAPTTEPETADEALDEKGLLLLARSYLEDLNDAA